MTACLTRIDASWIAAALQLPEGDPMLRIVRASPRLGARVLARVLEAQGLTARDVALGPEDLSGIDATLLKAEAADLLRAALWAAAAWHGQALRRVVLSRDAARLADALGADAFAHARRAAVPRAPNPQDSPRDAMATGTDADFLAARIRTEAEACLAAWTASLPEPLGVLIRLRFPVVPGHAGPDGSRALTAPLKPCEARAEALRAAARAQLGARAETDTALRAPAGTGEATNTDPSADMSMEAPALGIAA